MNELVSILVPCYNHEKYVKEAITSIANNSYPNIEIIFIDDGSSDDSYLRASEVLGLYRTRFKNIIQLRQNNQGVVRTLNQMIGLSHGEYICLLASDDVLTENSISDRVLFLSENPHLDAVIGEAYLIDGKSRIINENAGSFLYHANTKMLNSKYFYKELIFRWSIVGPVLLLRKSVYSKIGIYSEKFLAEDKDFYLRMINKKILGYVDLKVAYYRVHSSNLSRNINTSTKIRLSCAKSNIDNSKNFTSIMEYLYLKSYYGDYYLLKSGNFILYFIYKNIRFVFVKMYLFLIRLNI